MLDLWVSMYRRYVHNYIVQVLYVLYSVNTQYAVDNSRVPSACTYDCIHAQMGIFVAPCSTCLSTKSSHLDPTCNSESLSGVTKGSCSHLLYLVEGGQWHGPDHHSVAYTGVTWGANEHDTVRGDKDVPLCWQGVASFPSIWQQETVQGLVLGLTKEPRWLDQLHLAEGWAR